MATRRPNDTARILAAVAAIPRGRVATYGEVAARAGLPRRARLVGAVLSAVGDGAVPWHRVVNASRRISLRGDAAMDQRRRLELEGVVFDASGRIARSHFATTVSRRPSKRPSTRGG